MIEAGIFMLNSSSSTVDGEILILTISLLQSAAPETKMSPWGSVRQAMTRTALG